MANPVLFNPDHMTVKQVKDCAQFARWIFDTVDRIDTAEPELVDNFLHHIRQHREQFVKAWTR